MLTILVAIAVGFVLGIITGYILVGDCECEDDDDIPF